MTTPLEGLGMIGDGETAALVSREGSIMWLCLPRFDSPACCAALLGNSDHGHFSIVPTEPLIATEQSYEEDTLVLRTEMTTQSGTLRIIDFMPIRPHCPVLVRMVECVEGKIEARMTAAFRFDYGNMAPWITSIDGSHMFHVGPDKIILTGTKGATVEDATLVSQLEMKKGDRHTFTLYYAEAHGEDPEPIDAERVLKTTRAYWKDWIKPCDRVETPYRDHYRRSLLTLKALIHKPTGGLVAAPTTSLPERPGGSMNWDYRYCWLRDATFTLSALTDSGFIKEATEWRDWILRAVAGEVAKMQVLYRVDGSRRLDEAELPWLPGYRFARPVRVGNKAADQFQLDIYGEVIEMLHMAEEAGMERTEQGRLLEHDIIRHIEDVWRRPDQGIWESREEPRHYTASKASAWRALDRFLQGARAQDLKRGERGRLAALRAHLHDVICSEGYNEGTKSFTTFFGGQEVDGSLLLLAKSGFLPPDDERIRSTVARIERELVEDGLVRRWTQGVEVSDGAFLACSFWLAECQLLEKRREDAVATIERAIEVGNGLGLLSEEYDLASKRLSGNYPQALSHLGLVNAVLALARYDAGQGKA